MKPLLRAVLIIASLVGGRLLAQQCVPCYNNITDGGPFGKYASQACFMGTCQNASSPSECYREDCKSCHYNPKLRKGCQAGRNYTCPAAGNCPNNEPIAHHVCVNLCGC